MKMFENIGMDVVFTVWPSLLSLARVKPRLAERPRDVNDIIRIL